MNGVEAEKEGRERILSSLRAVSTEPDMGLKPTNCEIMTWTETKSWTLNWLSHPGTPPLPSLFNLEADCGKGETMNIDAKKTLLSS